MWARQLRLCAVLLTLALPLGIADFALLNGNGSGFDFSGIVTGIYLVLLAIHLGLSSLAVKIFPRQSLWVLHGLSAVASVVLFSTGGALAMEWQDRRDRLLFEEAQAARAKLANVITLEGWEFSPDPEQATEIFVSVTVTESGRFSAGANGWGAGEYGEMFFHSEGEKQRKVEKGERFIHALPLKWIRPGVPGHIEITLYLFDDSTGRHGTNVTKVFTPNPEVEDDGHFFYGALPPPGNLHAP